MGWMDRSMALAPEYYRKAFNTFGIFYPVILYNGKIVGNWNKSTKKKALGVESSFFIPGIEVDEGELDKAKERFRVFNNGEND